MKNLASIVREAKKLLGDVREINSEGFSWPQISEELRRALMQVHREATAALDCESRISKPAGDRVIHCFEAIHRVIEEISAGDPKGNVPFDYVLTEDGILEHRRWQAIRHAIILSDRAAAELEVDSIAPHTVNDNLQIPGIHPDHNRALELALREAIICLKNECWISATIMSGKVIETIMKALILRQGGEIGGKNDKNEDWFKNISQLKKELIAAGMKFDDGLNGSIRYIQRVRNFVTHGIVLKPEPNQYSATAAFNYAYSVLEYFRDQEKHLKSINKREDKSGHRGNFGPNISIPNVKQTDK